ncbi:glycosyltransferase family 4 protein [Roseovarius sp. MMSF_3281]|uniref:glycosyltransferase family 4 protein n=1 Tax=Roseovarius sp. MMSF_3281 TaxID=3046694 RepID=UPI00273F2625|nr:glycosyltransferase family 4 protein [Roseovarius sp. MMSF_3281]
MTDPTRNAAIWYAEDGYAPDAKGMNGRRVAGASFLKGFFRHADVSEFVSLSQGRKGAEGFASKLKADCTRDIPHRAALTGAPLRMAPVETLYFPAPNYAAECWKRQHFGMAAYAICGVTHTTATQAVMQGFHDLRAAPQAPWDAVICTSRAVHAATLRNIELADEHLHQRFGQVPPRPLMPVIPLGINCDDFAHDAKARARLRERMNWTDGNIVVATLSRLLPYGKFDPAPLFIALERAQAQLPKGKRLNFVACGIYADDYSQKAFEDSAKALMPSVSYTHLDGGDATARSEALSGADIFTFPIDNIQETFGLAPIEAMAAGLPVITSDWDGMRDTVTEDVGIRIATQTVGPRHTAPEAWRYHHGGLSYAQYGNNLSAMTEINLPALTEAIVTLASDKTKRRAMGQAGQKRALEVYDWAKIIPQMQDLWAEQSAMRRAHAEAAQKAPRPNPVAPAPTDLFQSYPSKIAAPGVCKVTAKGDAAALDHILTARRHIKIGQMFEKLETLHRVLQAVQAAGDTGTDAQAVAKTLNINPLTIERAWLFFLKYGLIEVKKDG